MKVYVISDQVTRLLIKLIAIFLLTSIRKNMEIMSGDLSRGQMFYDDLINELNQ